MKKFKKLFLVVSIVAVLMVMMVVSVSANSIELEIDPEEGDVFYVRDFVDRYDDSYSSMYGKFYVIEPQDINTPLYDCKVLFWDFDDGPATVRMCFSDHFYIMVDFLIENWSEYGSGVLNNENLFDRFVYYNSVSGGYLEIMYENDEAIGYKTINENFGYFVDFDFSLLSSVSSDTTYFDAIKENKYSESFYYLMFGYAPDSISSYINSSFKLVDFFNVLCEERIENFNMNKNNEENEMLISNLEEQVTELNTTITEKDAVITEKDAAISTLQGENANLQIDVDSLNTQVENLVEEKTVINSELKALEAKMEREIDKAYEQGYEDADGFNFMPIIACLSVVVLIVTIISFVVTNKRKKRR